MNKSVSVMKEVENRIYNFPITLLNKMPLRGIIIS